MVQEASVQHSRRNAISLRPHNLKSADHPASVMEPLLKSKVGAALKLWTDSNIAARAGALKTYR